MSLEDERTRLLSPLSGGETTQPIPPGKLAADLTGATSARVRAKSVNVLPNGTRLAEFEVIDLIGEGGFGIVYLALDHSLERRVALKEYIPQALAMRGNGQQVTVKSPKQSETFQAGLRSFVNEAKLLAHFDHPALVKVHRFWEANGTAYMVMPLYDGVTLKQALSELPSRASEPWLKALLAPLTDALTIMHAQQCFHRDIAPDNVLILPNAQPVLLDFGAARRVIGDMTQALTVILKPGFAPVEQYADTPEMKQGPWTDVYALAALVYYAISGRPPTDSVSRMMNDTMIPAQTIGRGLYSDEFLRAIDAALVVQPERRTPSMLAFRRSLNLVSAQPVPHPVSAAFKLPEQPDSLPESPDSPEVSAQVHRTRTPVNRTVPLVLAILVVSLLVVSLAWYAQRRPETNAIAGKDIPVTALPAQNTPTVPTTPTTPTAPTVATGPTAPTSPSAPTAPQVTATPPEPISPSVTQSTNNKPAFSAALISELIFDARSSTWRLNASATPKKVEIEKDYIRLNFQSDRGGYLYVFMLGSNAVDWWLIFPNGKDRDNRIEANRTLNLPRKTWPLQATGPAGVTRFLALASETERDYSAAGLVSGSDFGRFDLTLAAAAYQASNDPLSLFAGRPICQSGQTNCAKTFGAARFQIEEVPNRSLKR